MSAVELRGVTKRFGEVLAVDGVSLAVRAGEFLTLLGASGCGKTTLLRLIAGFEQPEAGTVWLGGEEVTRVPPHRRNVNQVFQSYALFPHLTVRENVAFGLKRQGLPREEIARRVAEALALVELGGLEERRPEQLSGGQRQRVGLARALAPRPAVLLLDEPLSALDARLRQGMQVELKQLQRRLGTTFVMVTHDQEEALTMSDRIALVNRGRIEQIGEAQELYRRPATAFAAEFVGHANLLEVERVGEAGGEVALRAPGGLALRVAAERWHAGARRVLVRPEKVHVSKSPGAESGAFAATVEAVVFLGAMERLLLVTEAGLRLTALAAAGSALRETVRAGERVWAAIHADDVVVLRD